MNAVTAFSSARPPAHGKPGSAHPSKTQAPASISGLMRGPIILGAVIVILFFGVFGTWAALAPLSSGAIAPGVVNPSFSTRPIQHEIGGSIAAVHVIEGEAVEAGQLLVTLEPTQAEAAYALRVERWMRLLVTRARLLAQTLGEKALQQPAELPASLSVELEQFIATQRALLSISVEQLANDRVIAAQRVAQLDSQRQAIQAEIDALASQQALVNSELTDKQALLEQQLVTRAAVQAVQREFARLSGDIASRTAQLAEIQQSISEVETTALQALEQRRNEVAKESMEVNNQIAMLEEELASTRDTLDRTEIYSPVAGRVHDLRFAAADAVVGPREKIMEIVPADDELVVLARVAPSDIDLVHRGLKARLSLVPFANRNSLPLHGEVSEVAATVTVDERGTQPPYYQVRITIAQSELERNDVYLTPGMPADVTIITGERTMLQYLTDPFLRSLRNAFIYD